jgi:ribokinase
VGDDERGRDACDELRAAGVDARLSVDPELPTGTCLVLVEPNGERTMVPDAGANDALSDADLPGDLLEPGGHLHVAGYALLRPGSRPAARGAIARASKVGMTVSVDPSSSALLSSAFLDHAAGAGLLLPNASEAHALTGDSDPERAARALAERFGEVVVTLGAAGVLWTDGDEVLRAAAVPVEAVEDSTGAGDAFAAGLLNARVAGMSTAEALAAGCRLAARAVTQAGARP